MIFLNTMLIGCTRIGNDFVTAKEKNLQTREIASVTSCNDKYLNQIETSETLQSLW